MKKRFIAVVVAVMIFALTGCGNGVGSASNNTVQFEDFKPTLQTLGTITMNEDLDYDEFKAYAEKFGEVKSNEHVGLGALDGSGKKMWDDVSMFSVEFPLENGKYIPITCIKFNNLDGNVTLIKDYIESAKNIPVYSMDDLIKNSDATYRLASKTEVVEYYDILNGYVEHISDSEGKEPYDYYDLYIRGKDYCILMPGMFVDATEAGRIRSFLMEDLKNDDK